MLRDKYVIKFCVLLSLQIYLFVVCAWQINGARCSSGCTKLAGASGLGLSKNQFHFSDSNASSQNASERSLQSPRRCVVFCVIVLLFGVLVFVLFGFRPNATHQHLTITQLPNARACARASMTQKLVSRNERAHALETLVAWDSKVH